MALGKTSTQEKVRGQRFAHRGSLNSRPDDFTIHVIAFYEGTTRKSPRAQPDLSREGIAWTWCPHQQIITMRQEIQPVNWLHNHGIYELANRMALLASKPTCVLGGLQQKKSSQGI